MKINKLTKILGGAVALAAVFALSTSIASAYRGNPEVKGPDFSPERHTEMTKAFETNNYADWAELMSDKGRITEIVNADNFDDFVRAHELALAGDLDGAKNIRTELGLGLGNGNGEGKHLKDGNGEGNGRGNGQRRNS